MASFHDYWNNVISVLPLFYSPFYSLYCSHRYFFLNCKSDHFTSLLKTIQVPCNPYCKVHFPPDLSKLDSSIKSSKELPWIPWVEWATSSFASVTFSYRTHYSLRHLFIYLIIWFFSQTGTSLRAILYSYSSLPLVPSQVLVCTMSLINIHSFINTIT